MNLYTTDLVINHKRTFSPVKNGSFSECHATAKYLNSLPDRSPLCKWVVFPAFSGVAPAGADNCTQ